MRRVATACHQSIDVQSNILNRETYKATQDTRSVVGQISEQGNVLIDELHELREELELRDARDSKKAITAADALNGQLELLKGDLIAAVEQSLCEYQYISWIESRILLTTRQGGDSKNSLR